MANWPDDELRRIAEADDLHIAPFREDGVTYGTSTWIWSVAVDGDLYVRVYNGRNSRWHQAALRQKAGRITAAGMTRDVAFEPVEGPVNGRIDDAYRAKYHGSPYLGSSWCSGSSTSGRGWSARPPVRPRRLLPAPQGPTPSSTTAATMPSSKS